MDAGTVGNDGNGITDVDGGFWRGRWLDRSVNKRSVDPGAHRDDLAVVVKGLTAMRSKDNNISDEYTNDNKSSVLASLNKLVNFHLKLGTEKDKLRDISALTCATRKTSAIKTATNLNVP